MPRSRFADETTYANQSADGRTSTPGTRYVANTNLIKISDWLTTIVVGLTLVNMDQAITGARTLATALQAPLGAAAYSGAVGLAMIVIGFVAGLALMFFWITVRGRDLLENSPDADPSEKKDSDEPLLQQQEPAGGRPGEKSR